MTPTDYDPKKVQAGGYHHSWSLISPEIQNSLEKKTGYGVRLVNSNEDYSEIPKTKYSEGHPEIPEYFLG